MRIRLLVCRVGHVLALMGLLWLIADVGSGWWLATYRRQLANEGVLLRPEQLLPQVPERDNAAPIYTTLFAPLARRDQESRSLSSNLEATLNEFMRGRVPQTDAGCRVRLAEAGFGGSRIPPQLTEAGKLPYCVFPVAWEQGTEAELPQLRMMETGLAVILTKAVIAAGTDGRLGWDWCLCGVHMCAHMASDPGIPEQDIAFRMMAALKTAMMYVATHQRIAPEPMRGGLVALQLLDSVQQRAASMTPRMQMALVDLDYYRVNDDLNLLRPCQRLTYLWALKEMVCLAVICQQPYRTGAAEIIPREYRYVSRSKAGVWPEGLIDTWTVRTKADVFAVHELVIAGTSRERECFSAEVRLTALGISLAQRSLDRGTVPGNLGALTDVPQEMLVDPFSGQPMGFRRLPAGALVYSVGQDLVDDGGICRRDPGFDERFPSYGGKRSDITMFVPFGQMRNAR